MGSLNNHFDARIADNVLHHRIRQHGRGYSKACGWAGRSLPVRSDVDQFFLDILSPSIRGET